MKVERDAAGHFLPRDRSQKRHKSADSATPRSLRRAINAFCRWCIHDPKSGIGPWRVQVEACESRDCPLWSVRPMSRAGK